MDRRGVDAPGQRHGPRTCPGRDDVGRRPYFGGHINPAMSIACAVTGRHTVEHGRRLRAGATVGRRRCRADLDYHVSRRCWQAARLGAPLIRSELHVGQAVLLEAVLTSRSWWRSSGRRRDERGPRHGGGTSPWAPWPLGHAAGRPFTGRSMNPARALVALAGGVWDHQLVYWVGSVIGAVLAAGCFTNGSYAGSDADTPAKGSPARRMEWLRPMAPSASTPLAHRADGCPPHPHAAADAVRHRARRSSTSVTSSSLKPTADGVVGYGEAPVLPEPVYNEETVDHRVARAERLLRSPAVVAARNPSRRRGPAVGRVSRAPDGESRAGGRACGTCGRGCAACRSARRWAACAVASPPAWSLGIADDVDDARCKRWKRSLRQGYRRIKVKIEPGRDADVLRSFAAAISRHRLGGGRQRRVPTGRRRCAARLDEFRLEHDGAAAAVGRPAGPRRLQRTMAHSYLP